MSLLTDCAMFSLCVILYLESPMQSQAFSFYLYTHQDLWTKCLPPFDEPQHSVDGALSVCGNLVACLILPSKVKKKWLIIAECQMSNFSSCSCLMFPSKVKKKWLIIVECQLYHIENKLHSNKWWCLFCARPIRLRWIFIVLVQSNNSQWVDMSLHSEMLSWFQANQSFPLLTSLAEKQQISILTHQ